MTVGFERSNFPPWIVLVPHDLVETLVDCTVGDPRGKGLLQIGVEDIGEKCVFDGKLTNALPFGAKITCQLGI